MMRERHKGDIAMRVYRTKVKKPLGCAVVVHGASEHHGRYEWLSRRLLSAGFHVVIGDLPGHGKNPHRRGHIDHFEEYIHEISNWIAAAGAFDRPLLLIGHSLGGLAVIRTLQEKAITPRAVVLSSPCLGLYIPPPGWLKTAARPLNTWVPKLRIPIKRSADNRHATRNKTILEKDAKDPYIVKKVSIRWYFELERAMGDAFAKADRFPDVPLFILQAGRDRIVDKRAVYHWYQTLGIGRKHYKEWPGLFHEVFNEPEREAVFQYMIAAIAPYF